MRFFTMIILLSVTLLLTAQQKPQHTPVSLRDYAIPNKGHVDIPVTSKFPDAAPLNHTKLLPTETQIGETQFDLQTNLSLQNRIYRFNDGTVGATWTMGFNGTSDYPDRGTGYNYFDGTSWGTEPSTRIESIRTGWPSYVPYGSNGEAIIAHSANGYLVMNKRETKGSGNWSQTFYNGPAGHGLYWPRMISAGEQNNTFHLLSVTESTVQGGTVYEGLDGAILYSRSTDGGQTWDIKDSILPGLTSAGYHGFDGDMYTWAEPKGDTLAFVVNDYWLDFILMKSTDGGDTWTKTTIWENPYPFFDRDNPISTDTFYCADGAIHLAFDSDGMVHIVFGVNRAHSDGTKDYWFPFIDGIGYWNESMPPFESENFKYTMQPDTLFNHGNLIAWTQDMNDNDTLDFLPGSIEILGTYYVSLSSMPQLVIDENDDIYVIYSSVTENYDNGIQNFRHLWGRALFNGQSDWSEFIHLTGSIVHNFDECIFPSLAANNDDNLYFIYMTDEEPGLSVRGDEDAPTDNNILFASLPKADFGVGITEMNQKLTEVGAIYPNPSSGNSTLPILLSGNTDVSLSVYSLSGKLMSSRNIGPLPKGQHQLEIDCQGYPSGLYFVDVKLDKVSIIKKLIIR